MEAVNNDIKDILISNARLLEQIYNGQEKNVNINKIISELEQSIKHLFSLYISTTKKIDIDFINEVLFLQNTDGTKRINKPIFSVLKENKTDMQGISFDGVHIKNHSFEGLQNVVINIDKVPEKDISKVKFTGVLVIGSLECANVEGTNFKGCISKLVLNPQKVKNKSLKNTVLEGIEIIGEEIDLFQDVCIEGTDFTGTLGNPKINPQTVKSKSFLFTKLNGVELVGDYNQEDKTYDLPCFDGCRLSVADFTGAKGQIIINLQKISYQTIGSMRGKGITFIGSLKGIVTDGTELIDCYHKESDTEPVKKLVLS